MQRSRATGSRHAVDAPTGDARRDVGAHSPRRPRDGPAVRCVSRAPSHTSRELAVRLALGAEHGHALRLVLGEGARLVALGLLIGTPGIYVANHLIRGFLVGVSPFDSLTLLVASFGLLVVAMTTCYIPARRVLAIEPAQLLRQE